MRRRLEVISAALISVGVLWAGPALGAVDHVATLVVPGQPGLVLGPIAASGGTVAAGGSNDITYVFSQPAAGWANGGPVAALVDPDADGAEAVAISESAVVVDTGGPTGASFMDVFVEPPGGWSGTVQPSARLIASNGVTLYGPAISGRTIVAQGTDRTTSKGSEYVFTEPPGGWAGTLEESARLTDSGGASLSEPAVSGSAVVAGAQAGRADVFLESLGGWSGVIHQGATLAAVDDGPPNPVAFSGQTILAGFHVFTQPATGWKGIIRPAATLIPESPISYVYGYTEATSGAVAAVGSYNLTDKECPCQGAVWVFTEPAHGWSGGLVAEPALTPVTAYGPVTIALQGETLYTTGGNAVEIYQVVGTAGRPVGRPRITGMSLAGLAVGKPIVRLSLMAAAGAPPMQSVWIGLPRGLSFSRAPGRLRSGITASGSRIRSLRVIRGGLLVTLRRSTAELSITIDSRALQDNSALETRVLQVSRGGKLVLHLRATVTDIVGDVTSVKARTVAR
jgi:hypothetical protein